LVDPGDPSRNGAEQRCIECPLGALVHSTEAGRDNAAGNFCARATKPGVGESHISIIVIWD
jgi:hypothetical protein